MNDKFKGGYKMNDKFKGGYKMNDEILELINEPQECVVKENMNRNRPYLGQPHTDYGERGKTYVEGLTMRDICDCFIRGFINAANHVVPESTYQEVQKGEDAKLDSNDLYGFDLDKVDPMAINQNMMVEIEKMMGIFPNIDKGIDIPIEVGIEDDNLIGIDKNGFGGVRSTIHQDSKSEE